MDQGPGSRHIASPDVHIDDEARQIRMYFHQPAPEHRRSEGQLSYVAHSGDGLAFTPRDQVLGLSYFRVFQHGGWYYALAKNFNTDGILYRSRDGLYPFETGPSYIPRVRHTAVWTEGSTLFALYSRIGDTPESILLSTVDLKPDWHQWQFSSPELVLAPQTPWEGAEEKMEPSRPGAKNQPVHQVRDPAVFSEAQKRYLLYSVAGEQGIAIARLEPIDT